MLICQPQAAFFPLIKLKPNQQTEMTQRISINFNLNRKKANLTTQEFLLGIFNPSEEDTEQKGQLGLSQFTLRSITSTTLLAE